MFYLTAVFQLRVRGAAQLHSDRSPRGDVSKAMLIGVESRRERREVIDAFGKVVIVVVVVVASHDGK